MLIISFICYLLVGVISIVFGVIYLTRIEFMPYHQVALNRTWKELESEIQTLILALMRVAGGGLLATGISLLLLFLTYLKTQEPILFLIMPIVSGITSFASFSATMLVKTRTVASPPLKLTIICIMLITIGAITSVINS